MKKLTIFIIIIMVITIIGTQFQMLNLKKEINNNSTLITETTEVLKNVVDYLKGF